MRLKSAIIKNYRIHKDLNVTFDPQLTLISGPNESGKSTLVEAIHRALFFRAKASGGIRDAMNSCWGDTPEVTVVFEAGGKDIILRKVFSSNRGDCYLSIPGEGHLTGDAAETRLATLLKYDAPVTGRGAEGLLGQRWTHLWTWQGSSGDSPFDAVSGHRDRLVQRLRNMGGPAVAQSDLDTQVLQAIQARYDATFTDRGSVRKGTLIYAAQEDMTLKQRVLLERDQLVQQLEHTADSYARAVSDLAGQTARRAEADQELQRVKAALASVGNLQRTLEPLDHEIRAAEDEMAHLQKVAGDLAAARQEQETAACELAPAEAQLNTLRRQQESCRTEADKAEDAMGAAAMQAKAAGNWKQALEAHLKALELKAQLDGLVTDSTNIAARRAELAAARTDIANTPPINSRTLAELNRLSTHLAAATAAHSALAAKIRVDAATAPVVVDGTHLQPGETRLVTSDVTVRIGDVATLRITPGGDTSIKEALRELEAARDELRSKLASLGVASMDEAMVACEKLRQLEERTRALQRDLERLDADGNEARLCACRQNHADAMRKAEALSAETGRPLPADLVTTHVAVDTADTEHRLAVSAQTVAAETHVAAVQALAQVEQQLKAADAAMAGIRSRVQSGAVRISTIEELNGTDEVRAARLLTLRAARDEATARRLVVGRQIDDLQPARLKLDADRWCNVLDLADKAIRDAELTIAGSGAVLRRDGNTDPRVDLEQARAAFELAERRCAELQAEADAVKHLAETALALQREVADSISEPLALEASKYLQCIFGSGSDTVLVGDLTSTSDQAIRVNRANAGFGTFLFSELSDGTREQVGVAFRLAMAGILAADHDGCLPLVLDDAFANSDRDRIQALQQMLYFAAKESGLQIIVLTCNPDDYRTLGAAERRLERTHITPVMPAPAAESPISVAEPPVAYDGMPPALTPTSLPDDDDVLFMRALASVGGKAGNVTLQGTLGWPDMRYGAAKDRLCKAGRIDIGRGRGGSVLIKPGATLGAPTTEGGFLSSAISSSNSPLSSM